MALSDYIYHKPTIESERLILRPTRKDDVSDLKEWLPDNSIYTYWGKGPSKAEKNPELLFEKKDKPTKSFYLGIECKEIKKVIGDIFIYLIENDRMASVAIRLASSYQGKGYGTEALCRMVKFCFENTELKRLWAEVDTRNISSQRIFEKSGFKREGLVRQGKMVNVWCDYYIYGILDTDYKEMKSRLSL